MQIPQAYRLCCSTTPEPPRRTHLRSACSMSTYIKGILKDSCLTLHSWWRTRKYPAARHILGGGSLMSFYRTIPHTFRDSGSFSVARSHKLSGIFEIFLLKTPQTFQFRHSLRVKVRHMCAHSFRTRHKKSTSEKLARISSVAK